MRFFFYFYGFPSMLLGLFALFRASSAGDAVFGAAFLISGVVALVGAQVRENRHSGGVEEH